VGNEKMKKQSSFIAKKRPNPKSIKQDIKDYHCAMLKHMMEFSKQLTSLKNPLLEYYFTSFLKDLSNEDLVALRELLATEFAKPEKKTICNSKQVGLGPTT
jgi:hypothetical protein